MLARIALSGICSIRPAPNTGVGMRKMTLLFCSSWLKFGCASVQPFAPVRPVMVKRACTPPSAVPSGFLTYRPVRFDKGGHEIGSAVPAGECHLRVHGRAGPPDRRLQMTAGALVEIHPRTQALGNTVHFLERIAAPGEKRGFGTAQPGYGATRARRPAAHSGILSLERGRRGGQLRRCHLDLESEQKDNCRRQR